MMPEGADKIRVVRAGELRPGQPTAGMVREEAFGTGSIWAGLVRTEPGMRSGWHHHGSHETAIYVLSGRLRMESGPGGMEAVEGGPGDFIHVPAEAVHRESNPTDKQSVAVIMRSGTGEVVVNVDCPEP
jgi:uncharacterized RmlC-like cupin family protein